MDMKVVSLTNVGKLNQPIPALTFELRYNIATYVSVLRNLKRPIQLQGDGRFIQYQ